MVGELRVCGDEAAVFALSFHLIILALLISCERCECVCAYIVEQASDWHGNGTSASVELFLGLSGDAFQQSQGGQHRHRTQRHQYDHKAIVVVAGGENHSHGIASSCGVGQYLE